MLGDVATFCNHVRHHRELLLYARLKYVSYGNNKGDQEEECTGMER
jgi:hypothetical protein